MISAPLWKRNMLSGFKLMLAFLAILSMYTIIIIWMYDPELSQALDQYAKLMPEVMAAVGMTGETGTLLAHINTYLYGFIMLLIPMIFVIMLVNKLIMRYIDNGSMVCLLATPNSRRKIIITQLCSIGLLVVILMVIMTGIGMFCSQFMFPGELDVPKYILLNAATLLLQLAVSGIAVAAACFFSDTKWYMLFGAGLPLLFYLFQMLSNMGEELEILKYATLFTLMPGIRIIEGKADVWKSMLTLGMIWIILYVIGKSRFQRRDLSL